MTKRSLALHSVLWCLMGAFPTLLWANPPNVVLSRALHFSSTGETSITLAPGKYYIEQAGPSELQATPEGNQPGIILRAESLKHEQYELFTPMALTRPQKDEEFLIELLLPGGVRLVARGSAKPPPPSHEGTKAQALPPVPLVQEGKNGVASHRDPTSPSPPQEPTPNHPDLFRDTPPALPSNQKNLLSYHAPDISAQGRRVLVDDRTAGKEPLYLSVLSPDHVGLTMFEQPALFWFIDQLTSQPVDVIVVDESNTHILLDVRLLPPIRPGIHKVELKDYGIRLQPHMAYQWKIILHGNSPQETFSTSGWIMRIPPPANVTSLSHFSSINSLPPGPLIEAGLWYDALWVLSERIQTQPADPTDLKQRASLFDQVGLSLPANHDRSHLSLP